jgi:hypothetical protein
MRGSTARRSASAIAASATRRPFAADVGCDGVEHFDHITGRLGGEEPREVRLRHLGGFAQQALGAGDTGAHLILWK